MELLHIITVIEEDVKEEEETGYVLLSISSQTVFDIVYCSHLNNLNLTEADSVFHEP